MMNKKAPGDIGTHSLTHSNNTFVEKFRKNLKDVIDSFEKAKEWADLSNCLQKVKKQFELHQNTDIPLKKDLAKRLGIIYLFVIMM